MRQTDEALEATIYKTLRRCSHEMADSRVAERIATAIILRETAIEASGRDNELLDAGGDA